MQARVKNNIAPKVNASTNEPLPMEGKVMHTIKGPDGQIKWVAEEDVKIWTSMKQSSSLENAIEHWNNHSAEFPEYTNSREYVEGAYDFMHNSPEGTLSKVRINGDILKYYQETNTFGVMIQSGAIRTMFRPTDGMSYWLNLK